MAREIALIRIVSRKYILVKILITVYREDEKTQMEKERLVKRRSLLNVHFSQNTALS